MFVNELYAKPEVKNVAFTGSDRSDPKLANKDNPFGTYNVDQYSLEYRMKKKK